MAEDNRSMTQTVADAIADLLEVHLACTLEMVNMGDWTYQDYLDYAKPYEDAVVILKKTGKLEYVDPKIYKAAANCLENFAKGMGSL